MRSKNTNIIYGINAVAALLERAPGDVLELFVQDAHKNKRVLNLVHTARHHTIGINITRRSGLDKLCDDGKHQGIAAAVRKRAPLGDSDLIEIVSNTQNPLLLILDGVEDPRNLGACLRSAAAAGVVAVVAPRGHSAGLTGVAQTAASGAADLIPYILVGNIARTLRTLKESGVWLIGADARSGLPHYQGDLTGACALVLGGEGRGLRRLTADLCDVLVHIPMTNGMESLNVSVAAGVLLYEAVRQRA